MATPSEPDSLVTDDAVAAAGAVMVTRGSVREVLEAALPHLYAAIVEGALCCTFPVHAGRSAEGETFDHCDRPVDWATLRCDLHTD